MGYDLEGMKLEFDEARKVVHMTAIGPPQLLALKHDVDFYDLEAGTFASFKAADHSPGRRCAWCSARWWKMQAGPSKTVAQHR